MASRLELQSKFEELLNSRNVYYKPPASVKMKYPAIKYSLKDFDVKYANNSSYLSKPCYEVTLIDTNPDSIYVELILKLPNCSFDRYYKADNLNHFTFTIYH